MYNDAIKCYQQAIRIDSSNLQIMKDLSLLQIQRRMVEGFTETRRLILVEKPNNRNNWIAYALGSHLSGKYSKALSILESYMKSQEGVRPDFAALLALSLFIFVWFRFAPSILHLIHQSIQIQNTNEPRNLAEKLKKEYEDSEMLLYKNMIIEESGNLEQVREPDEYIFPSFSISWLRAGKTFTLKHNYLKHSISAPY